MDEARMESVITAAIEPMGYDLVRVRLSGGHQPTLQVMAERRDGEGMSVDDCELISRALSAHLDVEDPIPGAYTLEVSSPGIDRPLTRAQDYARFAGHEAKVELREPVDGRRRFRGRVLGLADDQVRIALPEGEVIVPFASISAAKLVLTDELIAAANKKGH
jgi:ribosome maturation factor RimP